MYTNNNYANSDHRYEVRQGRLRDDVEQLRVENEKKHVDIAKYRGRFCYVCIVVLYKLVRAENEKKHVDIAKIVDIFVVIVLLYYKQVYILLHGTYSRRNQKPIEKNCLKIEC